MSAQNFLNKHSDHQVDVVLTPHLKHHAKLVCLECNGQWLQWLSRADTSVLTGKQQPKKTQANKKVNWSNTKTKERQHYQSFQPQALQLPRTPTQLVNDRLALTGHNRFNGNHLGSIPTKFLQQLLDTNRINKKEDRQRLEYFIKLQIGT